MLQIYDQRLCRSIILVTGLFAAAAITVVALITFFTLPMQLFIATLLDEGKVAAVIFTMVILAWFHQNRWAGLVWGFGMPFALMWVLSHTDAQSNVLSVLIILVIVNGMLLPPRAVILAGLLEILLFMLAAIATHFEFLSARPGSELRALLLNVLLIGFSTAVMAMLNTGMLEVLARLQAQTSQVQLTNQTLQKQQAFQQQAGMQVGQLAATLSSFFQEQHSTSREQAALVNEVATTAQELDSAARRIADSALSVASVAEKALHSVEAGRKTAEDGTQAILILRGRVEHITVSVRSLNNQIERIGEVTNVIGEIAGETQLLALNATIEAAGAREFGRRFAAVAEEVNRLSRRITTAVEQIQETVTEVTEASLQSLKATEDGLRQAKQGTELVERLNSANQDVTQLVNQTSVLASSIASATQEQHTASSQIVTAVRSMSSGSRQLAQMGDKVAGVVAALKASLQTMNYPDEPQLTAPVDLDLGLLNPDKLDDMEIITANEGFTYTIASSQ